jgi:hypothetical protein
MKRAANKPGCYSDTAAEFFDKHEETIAMALQPALAAIVRSMLAFEKTSNVEMAPSIARAQALTIAQSICSSQSKTLMQCPDQVEAKFTEWASSLNTFARQCVADLTSKLRKPYDKAA